MRFLFQKFWIPIYRKWGLRHVQKIRRFRLAGLDFEVPPAVFHPLVYFSTPIFLDFLKEKNLAGSRVLDVGTGSGALAMSAKKQGAATVVGLDINPAAVETARRNAAANDLQIEFLESDLFEKLPAQHFDFVLINPPYYPKTPASPAEFAFFAGENHEYFERLFAGLPAFCHASTAVWLILSEDCDWSVLQKMAARRGQVLSIVFEKNKWGERLVVAVLQKME